MLRHCLNKFNPPDLAFGIYANEIGMDQNEDYMPMQLHKFYDLQMKYMFTSMLLFCLVRGRDQVVHALRVAPG